MVTKTAQQIAAAVRRTNTQWEDDVTFERATRGIQLLGTIVDHSAGRVNGGTVRQLTTRSLTENANFLLTEKQHDSGAITRSITIVTDNGDTALVRNIGSALFTEYFNAHKE